jgi:hypothetical protein
LIIPVANVVVTACSSTTFVWFSEVWFWSTTTIISVFGNTSPN